MGRDGGRADLAHNYTAAGRVDGVRQVPAQPSRGGVRLQLSRRRRGNCVR